MAEYERKLDQAVAKAKQLADDLKAASLTFKPTSAAPNLPFTIATPTLQLAAPVADLAELQKIQTDTNEAWKKAGEVLQGIETPMQKYDAGLAVSDARDTRQAHDGAVRSCPSKTAGAARRLFEQIRGIAQKDRRRFRRHPGLLHSTQ